MIITIITVIVLFTVGIALTKFMDDPRPIVTCIFGCLILAVYVILFACGGHLKDNENFVKDRLYIIAAINSDSDDPAFREQAVQEAVQYNQKIQRGKERRNSIWTNWITDPIWDDAEFIALDMSDVTVKE